MRLDRFGGLMLAGLFAAGGPPAVADEVFTPLTAVPFAPTTTPVPGTDGKWHLVYELELANTRIPAATLEEVKVIAPPSAEADTRVLAEFGADTFVTRLKQLDNQPARPMPRSS